MFGVIALIPTPQASGQVWLQHAEAGDARTGYAKYNPRTGYVTCTTCALEVRIQDVQAVCSECGGTVTYDAGRLACDGMARHEVALPS